jgi:hypothetical protein
VVKALALGASLERGMGSNPIACKTAFLVSILRGCSSLGRAVGSQSAGTGIETLLLHFFYQSNQWFSVSLKFACSFDSQLEANTLFSMNLSCWWGCSSNGRAPALHAGCTGIDTLLLQVKLFFKENHGEHIQGALAQW